MSKHPERPPRREPLRRRYVKRGGRAGHEWSLSRKRYLPGEAAMSDTLVEFAEPLFDDIPAAARRRDYGGALQMAALAWNLTVLTQATAEVDFDRKLTELVGRLDTLPPPGQEAEFLDLVRALALRKLALFPEDHRIVMNVQAARRGQEVRVKAMSVPTGRAC